MTDTADDVADRLDGNSPVAANQTISFDGENVPAWRPVTLYRTVVDSQDRNVPRTNSPAAQPWNSPSTLDQATVLAEALTVVYQDPQGGRWTLSDMVIELFKAHLGVPTKVAGA
jgi:hypothetical protein